MKDKHRKKKSLCCSALPLSLLSLLSHPLYPESHPFNEGAPPVTSWRELGSRYIAPEKLYDYDLLILSYEKYILTFAFQEGQQQLYAYFDLEKLIDHNEANFLHSLASLIERVIPKILFKRITGLYIYNSESETTPEQLALLIKAIRYHYPYVRIMLPYDTEGIEELTPFIDALLFTSFFKKGERERSSIARDLLQRNRKLLLLSRERAVDKEEKSLINEEAKSSPVLPFIVQEGEEPPL